MLLADWWPEVSIDQHVKLPSQTVLDRMDALLVVSAVPPHELLSLPYLDCVLRRYRRELSLAPKPPSAFSLDLPNGRSTRLHWLTLDPALSAFKRLTQARKAIEAVSHLAGGRLPILVVDFVSTAEAETAAEAVLAAGLARAGRLPEIRKETRSAQAARSPTSFELYGLSVRHGFARTLAEAEGAALTRYLTTLPPNVLTPGDYRRRVAELARKLGWQMTTYSETRLSRMGAGAFTAVSQGSPDRDAAIVHLRYRPNKPRPGGPVSLVGKGICFDTGGVNLKSARYMRGMHGDMAGSATALGTLLALTRLKSSLAVDCWLALAQNHVGPLAYKPNDVVTALNGTSIEVVHTDAEGRMVLADTLTLASRARPRPSLIIDYATLTGACVQALGKSYSGVFSRSAALAQSLVDAGVRTGERVWAFPMDEDYDQALNSSVADVLQCSPDGEADHIIAARFLSRFVEGAIPWAHIDLSSGTRKGGLAHVPCEETGFGVRLTLDALLHEGLAGTVLNPSE